MSDAAMPARSSARRPASAAISEVMPPTRRSLMPVRSVIQASLVSRRAERSSFVTTLSGTEMPQLRTEMPRTPAQLPAATACIPT